MKTTRGQKPDIKKAAKELIAYIEERHITDEEADDGYGRIDTWRSGRFDSLIENLRQAVLSQ